MAGCFAAAAVASASDLTFELPLSTVGIRVGFETDADASLTSCELYGTSHPKWSWDLGEKMAAGISWGAAVGALAGEGEVAAYGYFGVVLELTHVSLPVFLVAATGMSLYSEDTFGNYDMGGNIQFTSSIGLGWRLCDSWSLEYRCQHTSNAGLYSRNPGLDMHVFGVAYRF